MPLSDISRISVSGSRSMDGTTIKLAAAYAKEAAIREIYHRCESGYQFPDHASYEREYKHIYRQQYYEFMARLIQQEQPRIVYVERSTARKYSGKFASGIFSRSNGFIRVSHGRVTFHRLKFNLDDDQFLETKEAFLSAWPGPLDRLEEKSKLTYYIDTLWQHDSQRRIRYCDPTKDEQRGTILKILTELLHRNGSIDASCVTGLLLRPERYQIKKDDGNRNPLEMLQKYLLLGKRSEAIKFAKAKKLWDHAQCLAFLEKYQPGYDVVNYQRDRPVLKDDTLMQLNDDYISSLDHEILPIVYRSLLNRILQTDPESASFIKNHNVKNNYYEFALLCANDCGVEFDQTNEIFKLILASKQARANSTESNYHIISLGHSGSDSYDTGEDLSYRSHPSFSQTDTPDSKLLILQNIDTLLLNEIWEYCYNLARGASNGGSTYYNFIGNLIPYKVAFASKLLDLGLYDMFASYLYSIESALHRIKAETPQQLDTFFHWGSYESRIEVMKGIWEELVKCPELPAHLAKTPEHAPRRANFDLNSSMPSVYPPINNIADSVANNEFQSDYVDPPSLSNQFNPISYPPESAYAQSQYIPPPLLQQPSRNNQYPSIPEAMNDFSPEEPMSPPNMEGRNPDEPKMTSSSPVDSRRESTQSNHIMGESFGNAFSPISRYDDLPKPIEHEQPPFYQSHQQPPINSPPPPQMVSNQSRTNEGTSSMANNNSSVNNRSKPSDRGAETSKGQPSGDQQAGILYNLIGSAKSLLPKSNSKQMILPEDNENSKSLVYDEQRGWVDRSQPEGADNPGTFDAPPIMSAPKQPDYSFKPTKPSNRYPRA